MPAIDPRLFWERDFSINERFNYECGQPANRLLIYTLSKRSTGH
jgi:hypothetical protein